MSLGFNGISASFAPKAVYGASVPPTATDDASKQFELGSVWIVRGVGSWTCIDNTVGAAVWTEGGGGGGTTPGTVVSGSTGEQTGTYTAAAGQLVRVDTRAASATITLPTTPADGTRIGVLDVYKTFGANVCILTAGGATIQGFADDMALDVSGLYVEIHYSLANNGWIFLINPMIGGVPLGSIDGGTF